MKRISSGSPWEAQCGYSRAVAAGGLMFISATAATGPDGAVIGDGDLHRQTQVILGKLRTVLQEAGGDLADVAQTRLYLVDITGWAEAGRAHAEAFGNDRPAMSMVHVKPFLDPKMLIEIEAVALSR